MLMLSIVHVDAGEPPGRDAAPAQCRMHALDAELAAAGSNDEITVIVRLREPGVA